MATYYTYPNCDILCRPNTTYVHSKSPEERLLYWHLLSKKNIHHQQQHTTLLCIHHIPKHSRISLIYLLVSSTTLTLLKKKYEFIPLSASSSSKALTCCAQEYCSIKMYGISLVEQVCQFLKEEKRDKARHQRRDVWQDAG